MCTVEWKVLEIVLAIFCGSVLQYPRHVSAITSYSMERLCDKEIPMIVDHIYQGQLALDLNLWPDNSTSEVAGYRICELTISAWYTWPRLQLQVTELFTECHLGYFKLTEVSDDWRGENPIVGLPAQICGTAPPVGTFLTRTRFLRIRFFSSSDQPFRKKVKIVFTSFRTDKCPEFGFQCQNGHCVEESLECNGHNPCGDDSDCLTNMLILVGIIGGSVGVCVFLTVIVCIYCYRRRAKRRREREEKESNRTADTSLDTVTNTTPDNSEPVEPSGDVV